jgi:hypothetical protein
VGLAAVPTTIIFRLLNFWLLLPVAAGCYYWLMHEPSAEDEQDAQAADQQPAHAPESVSRHAPLDDERNNKEEEAVMHASPSSE